MPVSRGLAATAAIVAALSALVADASATRAVRPPPGVPDPRLMVLTAFDLGRARVTSQGYYRDRDFPSVISYARELEGGRVGDAELLYVGSDAEIGTSPQSTSSFLRTIKRVFATKQGRKLVADAIADELQEEGVVRLVRVERPRGLGVGAGSFDLSIILRVLGRRIDAHVAAFRVDHVLGALITIGDPGERITRSQSARLARIMARRMRAQLVPRNTVRPPVTGSAVVGQTLTASRGRWTGGPSSFTFQWQRCDANGLSCAGIPGATGARYVVAEADVGSRLRVAVSARSSSGVGVALSTPTSVVPEVTPPSNLSPPTIAGTPLVGQTLTAQGAGVWTGDPVGFAFGWLRCDAAGGACVDIAGATSATYLVTSADVGATIRVAVTARNAAGEATAVSAPTAVVI